MERYIEMVSTQSTEQELLDRANMFNTIYDSPEKTPNRWIQ